MIFAKDKDYIIYRGSCLDILDTLPENSVDAIVTDPPYHLQSIVKRFGKEGSAPAQQGTDGSYARLSKGFMGKEWDGGDIAFRPETWQKCLRVLKHGGHILAFNHSRTFHRMAVAIEDAGFEIRDTIMWLYGSGFPKSHNVGLTIDKKLGHADRGHRIAVANRNHPDGTLEPNGDNLPPYEAKTEIGKRWQGWGSALKPAYEPIILARKPLQGTIAQNVLKWGVGGINVDECRVETDDEMTPRNNKVGQNGVFNASGGYVEPNSLGRFPANVIHNGSDEVVSGFPSEAGGGLRKPEYNKKTEFTNTYTPKQSQYSSENTYGDSGSASRFFYTAKASKKDRDEGLDRPLGKVGHGNLGNSKGFERFDTVGKNIHPTVKPTDLMQYLIRLITPKGGTILDPFMGSGSTGKAAMIENNERNADYHFIGIDLEQEYCEIAQARIEFGVNYREELAKIEEAEKIAEGQINMFDFEATL